MVEVDEHLGDPRAGEGVEPNVKEGAIADRYQALWRRVGDGPQPGSCSRRQQKGLHLAAFRTTPSARIRALASARTPSSPPIPSSQDAYAATESAGVRLGSQPSFRKALMSDWICRVSPKRYSPVISASSAEP